MLEDSDVLREGDDIIVADELLDGQIVWLERTTASEVVVRAVTQEMLDRYTGPLFAVQIDDDSGKAIFRQVRRDEVE